MRRLLLLAFLLPCALFAQSTTYTGTINDLSGNAVTSGKVTFTLKPGVDTTIAGTSRFSSNTITCTINSTGNLASSTDGTKPCTVINNTALTPAGTYYQIQIWPYYGTGGSIFNAFALGGTVDISTITPTPATQPVYGGPNVGPPGPPGLGNIALSDSTLGQYTHALFSNLTTAQTLSGPLNMPSISTPAVSKSVTDYGAKCDGTTDDTAAFQAATDAAGSAFASTGKPTIIQIPYGASGQCLLNSTVHFKSGTYWHGAGGSVLVTASGVTPFQSGGSGLTAGDVSYVEFDGVNINETTAGSAVGIYYLGGTGTTGAGTVTPQTHFYVKNSTIHGAGYAVIVNVYNQNDGNNHHLSDVQLTGNYVDCSLVSGSLDGNCRDGLHLSGDLSDFHMDGNTIVNRDDAALALTSTGGTTSGGFAGILSRLTPTNGTVSNNVCDNNAAGMDNSGGNDVQEVGNHCVSTVAAAPALRFIFDQYPLPTNISVVGGKYSASGGSLSDASVKMDFGGAQSGGFYPLCSCSISNAELGGSIYMAGNTFSLAGNRFDPGAGLAVNSLNGVQTQGITLAGNTWLGSSRTLTMGTAQGSLLSSNMINDHFNGQVSSFPLVASSTTYSYSSLPTQQCGSAEISTGQIVDCVTTQTTYGGGNDPSVTFGTAHSGSKGAITYKWDGPLQAPGIIPGTIYSAAGTALPACGASIQGETAVVSDASAPTYMGAYASGGAVTAAVICSYNGTAYSWLTH